MKKRSHAGLYLFIVILVFMSLRMMGVLGWLGWNI